MDDVRVLEAAHDVDYGVALADVREKLVAETLALGRAFDESGDVDELNDGGSVLLRVIHFSEDVEAAVRNGDDADVRVYRAERIVRGLRSRVCYCVEKGALADVRQTNDT